LKRVGAAILPCAAGRVLSNDRREGHKQKWRNALAQHRSVPRDRLILLHDGRLVCTSLSKVRGIACGGLSGTAKLVVGSGS
jgi:hypothetical protein